jgi:hypothetical protein
LLALEDDDQRNAATPQECCPNLLLKSSQPRFRVLHEITLFALKAKLSCSGHGAR